MKYTQENNTYIKITLFEKNGYDKVTSDDFRTMLTTNGRHLTFAGRGQRKFVIISNHFKKFTELYTDSAQSIASPLDPCYLSLGMSDL